MADLALAPMKVNDRTRAALVERAAMEAFRAVIARAEILDPETIATDAWDLAEAYIFEGIRRLEHMEASE